MPGTDSPAHRAGAHQHRRTDRLENGSQHRARYGREHRHGTLELRASPRSPHCSTWTTGFTRTEDSCERGPLAHFRNDAASSMSMPTVGMFHASERARGRFARSRPKESIQRSWRPSRRRLTDPPGPVAFGKAQRPRTSPMTAATAEARRIADLLATTISSRKCQICQEDRHRKTHAPGATEHGHVPPPHLRRQFSRSGFHGEDCRQDPCEGRRQLSLQLGASVRGRYPQI